MTLKRMLKGIFRLLFNRRYRFLYRAGYGKYDSMPDKEFLEKMYWASFGKELKLDSPQNFNEKLQWLKLYNRNPQYTILVDKYRVREYVSDKLGSQYLIPLLGVWDKPEDIDFDELPDRFVLKCNHNSGLGMCICKDKSQLNLKKTRDGLKKGLAENYYIRYREWPYKDVPRKIIAEQFMEQEGGCELKDYKIHCFNGKPRFVLVCSDRFSSEGLHEDFYDINWRLMDLHRPNHPNSLEDIQKPDNLEEMLSLAEKLSDGIPFVRVDFYLVDGSIYFSELTFFPASGFTSFEPEKWDKTFGDWLILPERN